MNFDVPADGPDAPLVHLVRRARLRYSRAYINKAILDHRDPNSLLALVEVAKGLGLTTKAVTTDLAGLESVALPAIVHFGKIGGDGGFGVVERLSSEGVALWDSVNGERTVTHELFASEWSGIVVMVEPGPERGPREKGYARRRLTERIAGAIERPSLVGERYNAYLRLAAALALGLLLLLSIVTASHHLEVAVLVTATVVGACIAALTVSSTTEQGQTSLKICGRGKLINCEGVLTSRYSRVFGLPLSEVGLAFFGAMLLLLVTASLFPDVATVPAVAAIAYVATIPFSIALVAVQVTMRQLCTLCMGIHLVNLTGATTSLVLLSDLDLSMDATVSGLLLLFLLFLLMLFFVIPHAIDGSRIDRQLGALRRIQDSPFATLAQILAQRPVELRGSECGVPIARPEGDPRLHELVAFVHPGCSRCWTVMQELGNIAGTRRVAVYLAVAPKDETEEDQRVCSAVVAAGLSGGPQAAFEAYRSAKEYLSLPAARRGAASIDAITSKLQVVPTEGDLQKARNLALSAGEFAQAKTEGTPAIFLDGRAVSAPPVHLTFLLTDHPDLLDPLMGEREVVS